MPVVAVEAIGRKPFRGGSFLIERRNLVQGHTRAVLSHIDIRHETNRGSGFLGGGADTAQLLQIIADGPEPNIGEILLQRQEAGNIGTNQGIRQNDVGGSAGRNHFRFCNGGAFEAGNTMLNEQTDQFPRLMRLHMGPKPPRITRNGNGLLDVLENIVLVVKKNRGNQLVRVGNAIHGCIHHSPSFVLMPSAGK